ncbi:transmembrane protein, partial [Trifolium medium]|nr:transmembrane protein [Trifolium medium]
PDAGAAGSVSNSVAMIGVSIVLSMFAIFKH